MFNVFSYLCTVKKVLYIHGFASAGSTGSATQMRNHLYPKGVQVISPDVPVDPIEAIGFLKNLVETEQPDVIVATSMGAMYAEQLRGIPRILVNPSFHMARLLTFGGARRQAFRNKRQDGATEFKIDRQLIDQFRAVEHDSFTGITPEDRQLVYGLFGSNDRKVNCQDLFRKHYGTARFHIFQGEHYLNGKVLDTVVTPLCHQILGI